MKTELAYGKNGLVVELPDNVTTIIEPKFIPGLPDTEGAVRSALRNPIGTAPLRQLVTSSNTVAISVCDITRPIPTFEILSVVLKELHHVPPNQIVILVATGTHRGNTLEELSMMLGADVVNKFQVVNHDAFNEATTKYVGQTQDNIPIWLNSYWLDAQIRITLGFAEPHFFAGFSGGPKMVAPGLAGIDTIMELHSPKLIGNPKSTWGRTSDNPIHQSIREITEYTGVSFGVDVTINRLHQITSVYAGEIFAEHEAAMSVAQRSAMQPVENEFDIVVTTNSGFPLDLNLYQTVKGLSAAAQIVKNGGSIVCASECSDGIPDHGEYGKIIQGTENIEQLSSLVNCPSYRRHDQWQVQLQVAIQQKAHVYLKSDYLSDQQIHAAYMYPVYDIGAKVRELLSIHGPNSKVCVLPQGPQTIPFVA
ncbi:MAG: nickel-dependent lactate racemase [Anaerolineales bacterium]|nr:nickel-dependent lactate racemase [Anaerolineales bacterium]